MGTQLDIRTTFDPRTDRQSKHTIYTLKDMLCAFVLSWKRSWEDHLPLVEYAYNDSYQASIRMAPYEALHGCRCVSPLCWVVVGEQSLVGPDWV